MRLNSDLTPTHLRILSVSKKFVPLPMLENVHNGARPNRV